MQTDFEYEYIEELISKFHKGEITAEELQDLISWYDGHFDEQVTINTPKLLTHEEIKTRMLDGLLSKIHSDQPVVSKRLSIKPWLWAASIAAVFILLFWIAGTDQQLESRIEKTSTAKAVLDSILPGGNKAVLLLTDGTAIPLDEKQQGIIVDGSIQYADGQHLTEKVDINTHQNLQLYVPRGGTYQITLSDGTKVWLNSDTRLHYPTQFSGNERYVELDGEAFFVVKSMYDQHNQRIPFIVKSKNQQIEVLGTQFNVNSYATQSFAKTTLVSGLVQVQASGKKIRLSPGQQSQVRGNELFTRQVNPQQYIAWKDGKFSFDDRSFVEIMSDIGRWYDLTIIYEGQIPSVELVGDAYRNERINLVLRLLDTSGIRYKLNIERRTLTIY